MNISIEKAAEKYPGGKETKIFPCKPGRVNRHYACDVCGVEKASSRGDFVIFIVWEWIHKGWYINKEEEFSTFCAECATQLIPELPVLTDEYFPSKLLYLHTNTTVLPYTRCSNLGA